MLIITGTIAYDYIMDFPGNFSDHINKDQIHQINLSFIVNKFTKRRGGTAGNVSYSLGLLKTPHTLFSVAGNDFDEYKKTFEQLKIDTSKVKIDPTRNSSTGFAMTDMSDNQIWGYFYGASEEIPSLSLSEVANRNDLVLIGPAGSAGSISFVKQCIKLKIPYVFDPGFILTQVKNNELELGIENASYIIGNDYEIALIKKRLKNWEELFEGKIIITTLGKNGALIEKGEEKISIRAVKTNKLVDPTGAGDAFRSGFLAGIIRNFDLKTSGQIGALAAVYAIENYGTQEHSYTLGEFKNRYRQAYGSMLKL